MKRNHHRKKQKASVWYESQQVRNADVRYWVFFIVLRCISYIVILLTKNLYIYNNLLI